MPSWGRWRHTPPPTLCTWGLVAQSPSRSLPAGGQCLELPESGAGVDAAQPDWAVTGPWRWAHVSDWIIPDVQPSHCRRNRRPGHQESLLNMSPSFHSSGFPFIFFSGIEPSSAPPPTGAPVGWVLLGVCWVMSPRRQGLPNLEHSLPPSRPSSSLAFDLLLFLLLGMEPRSVGGCTILLSPAGGPQGWEVSCHHIPPPRRGELQADISRAAALGNSAVAPARGPFGRSDPALLLGKNAGEESRILELTSYFFFLLATDS